MTSVPLHPALVHVPLGLAFVLPLVAAGLALGLWRGLVTRRAFLVLLALQGVLVVGGVLALRTGEGEEKTVERLVGKQPLHDHEEAAELFVWAAVVTSILVLAATALPGRAGRAVSAATVIATLGVAGLAYRAGKAGGELVYVRGAALACGASPASTPRPLAAKHDHHRDQEHR